MKMRCVSVQITSETGHTIEVTAEGGGEIVVESHGPVMLVRDTGMPPISNPDGSTASRVVAQIPATWAVFLQWEQTEAMPFPLDTSGGN